MCSGAPWRVRGTRTRPRCRSPVARDAPSPSSPQSGRRTLPTSNGASPRGPHRRGSPSTPGRTTRTSTTPSASSRVVRAPNASPTGEGGPSRQAREGGGLEHRPRPASPSTRSECLPHRGRWPEPPGSGRTGPPSTAPPLPQPSCTLRMPPPPGKVARAAKLGTDGASEHRPATPSAQLHPPNASPTGEGGPSRQAREGGGLEHRPRPASPSTRSECLPHRGRWPEPPGSGRRGRRQRSRLRRRPPPVRPPPRPRSRREGGSS
jgi:hypothetical protein